MKNQRLAQACHCACGESRFEIDGTPLTRFLCHCTICQSYTGAPYSDVTAFWAGAVSMAPSCPVTFRKYRPPPNVSRGLCRRCGKPVVEFMTLAPFIRLSFVPTVNFPDARKLPPPSAHIFYHRRVGDVEDSIPKISGHWPSELAVTRQILAGVLG